jgi:hypothetical protein
VPPISRTCSPTSTTTTKSLAPHQASLAVVVAAAGLGWRLWFRPSPDTRAWRRGAKGERRTARLLAPLEDRGWAILHDLAMPGSPANIDHLVIGPGGVLVIDSKHYRRQLRLDGYGMLWHGGHLLVSTLRKVRWEADQAEVRVPAIVAVHELPRHQRRGDFRGRPAVAVAEPLTDQYRSTDLGHPTAPGSGRGR